MNETNQLSYHLSGLLPYEKVFFTHYQCQEFEKGDEIYSLGIYSKGKSEEFSAKEEKMIKAYSDKVNDLLDQGLSIVHWNQDRPNYGDSHIKQRYKSLTGKDLNLTYRNEINLAEKLIFMYGQDYIDHRTSGRLDNLAELNNFKGKTVNGKRNRMFDIDRLMLLTKVYYGALNNTLKTKINSINVNDSTAEKDARFTFVNDFDDTEPESVYEYFKTGLVDSKMLSEKELKSFLIAAFQEQESPTKKFILKGDKTKEKIRSIFYKYYFEIAGRPHGKKKKYVELLGEYFHGWKTSAIMSNFNR